MLKSNESKILIVIPVYNNETTVPSVASDVKAMMYPVVFVDDGSTDGTLRKIKESGLPYLHYSPNRGKGYAIRKAFGYARDAGYDYVLTMDADGQHKASDICSFVEGLQDDSEALLVGARDLNARNMPGRNKFANRFSNFWFRVETGKKLQDTQSGFRLYPLRSVGGMRFMSRRYGFEVEVLVKSAWKGIPIKNIPISVYYPPQAERISHFKPFRDFARIGCLNAVLVLYALLVYSPWRFCRALTKENVNRFIRENITQTEESNHTVAASVGLGVFFGIAPIWGYQMVAAGIVAHFLKLNKVLSVISSNISIPPMIPFILYGSFCTGAWILGRDVHLDLQSISMENVSKDLFQYVFGACMFALACGISFYVITYVLLLIFRRKL